MTEIKKDLEFKDFVNWVFMALLVGSIGYGVSSIQALNVSVSENNRHVTTLIERTLWHEKELQRQHRLIKDIEDKTTKKFERIDDRINKFKTSIR